MQDFENIFAQNFSFWNVLEQRDKDLLLKYTRREECVKGQNIHGLKRQCTGVLFVESGCFRVYVLSDEGKEITLYNLQKGQFCMLTASCVLKSITFEVMVDATEDSRCLIVNPSVFSEISNRYLQVKNFILEIAIDKFDKVMWVMQQIMFRSMDKRLATFLVEQSKNTNSNKILMTNDKIAKYINSSREVVSRMFKHFKEDGIIEKIDNGIEIVDMEKLEDLLV